MNKMIIFDAKLTLTINSLSLMQCL